MLHERLREPVTSAAMLRLALAFVAALCTLRGAVSSTPVGDSGLPECVWRLQGLHLLAETSASPAVQLCAARVSAHPEDGRVHAAKLLQKAGSKRAVGVLQVRGSGASGARPSRLTHHTVRRATAAGRR